MQLIIQNFFNFFVSTMFWLAYIPVTISALEPQWVKFGVYHLRSMKSIFSHWCEFIEHTFCRCKKCYNIGGLDVVMQLIIQNFFNIFVSMMFWSAYIPVIISALKPQLIKLGVCQTA
jgi:hypothetical protein